MARIFSPGPETERAYRDALGCFATGVTVITAATATGPIGMTANSFTSISLTPPLIAWSPSKSSQRFPFFAAARVFNIHVLGDWQKDLALDFARRADAFDRVAHEIGDGGLPLLTDCVSSFTCRQHAVHDGGDHVIVVGHVDTAIHRDGRPLIFSQGAFGGFSG
ncbi:NADH-FMN oxidoreductase RutF, flavin reductase (DIM6/NTAB) family [Salinihabitans flavidus]|uniref:NADH-FMN oxidoreductase RutF, flavin reductase (DIM6/NTAB) family n=1 Tax=Salinihabitans flavidus TaxID=569882 RepID=A0A1H8PIB3_9RHOB|nr:flavin reductase family protein [Salinihabitans flavidus]SEO41655.1 NADH-FMN oxidoreductase RutF, flavin reductase (DIM6/NTAB) family [Salinihabitans flavidus]